MLAAHLQSEIPTVLFGFGLYILLFFLSLSKVKRIMEKNEPN